MTTTPDMGRMAANALQEVLTTQFKLDAVPAAGDCPSAGSAGPILFGSVQLNGPGLSASLHLKVPDAWAALVNGSLRAPGDATPSEADNEDLAAELCNMVAGRLAARLAVSGYASALSTSSFQRGPLSPSEQKPGSQQICTHWTCAGHVLTLILDVRLNPK